MLRIFDTTEEVGTLVMAFNRLGISYRNIGVHISDDLSFQTYQAIHGKIKNYSNTPVESIPTMDLFAYRLSTRDFRFFHQMNSSSSTKELPPKLTFVYSLIECKKPRYLVMETTKQVIGKNNAPHFKAWTEWLSTLGYETQFQLLNAKDYNLPQERERLYVVSSLKFKKQFEFPQPQPLTQTFRSYLESEVDDSYYLYSSFRWLPLKILSLNEVHPIGYYPSPTNPSKHTSNQTIYSLTGLCPMISTNDYKRPIKILLTPSISPQPIGNHRFKIEEPFWQTQLVRKLTPKECWRLMGLDEPSYDSFSTLNLSKTNAYRQIGQANVLPIWEGILKNLLT